jgi:hypothetical protein
VLSCAGCSKHLKLMPDAVNRHIQYLCSTFFVMKVSRL